MTIPKHLPASFLRMVVHYMNDPSRWVERCAGRQRYGQITGVSPEPIIGHSYPLTLIRKFWFRYTFCTPQDDPPLYKQQERREALMTSCRVNMVLLLGRWHLGLFTNWSVNIFSSFTRVYRSIHPCEGPSSPCMDLQAHPRVHICMGLMHGSESSLSAF